MKICLMILIVILISGCKTDETFTTSQGNTYKKVYTLDNRGRAEWTGIKKVDDGR